MKQGFRGVDLPEAGDDPILESYCTAWDQAGVITKVSSKSAAQAIAAINSDKITPDHPAYFDTGSIIWRFDGTNWESVPQGTYAFLTRTGTDAKLPSGTSKTLSVWDTTKTKGLTVTSGIVTIPAGYGGIYMLSASFSWESNSSGNRALRAYRKPSGGASSLIVADIKPPNDGLHTAMLVSTPVGLHDGDEVWVEVNQSSGSTLEISNNVQPQRFSLVWLSNS